MVETLVGDSALESNGGYVQRLQSVVLARAGNVLSEKRVP